MALSIAHLLQIGIERIWQHVQALQQPIVEWARQRDVEITSDLTPARRSGILCIRPRTPAQAHQALLAADVVCAFREQSIRLAPHWYNTPQEIGSVLEVLDTVVK